MDDTRGTPEQPGRGLGQTESGIWPYLGIGCIAAFSGAMATGVIAVLLAKIVSSATGCTNDLDPRAPCDWLTYWGRGVVLGFIVVPTLVIWRMKRVRASAHHREKRTP